MIKNNRDSKKNTVRVTENRPEIKKMLSVLRDKKSATEEEIAECWKILSDTCHSMFYGKFLNQVVLFDASCDYEDFAQNILIAAYEGLGKYDESLSCFGTWLFDLCWGKVSNYNKKRKKAAICFSALNNNDGNEFDISDIFTDGVSTEDKCMKNHNKETLMSLIKRLPFQYGQAIYFCEIEGRKVSEVAAMLGCTSEAISRRLCRGKEKLKEIVNKEISREDYLM